MLVPLLTRIDHVGIACRDLDAAIGRYQATFGLEVASLEVNEEQGVREAMLGVGAADGGLRPGYVQLLEPLGPDTPVGRFLARRGEGLHHVGYGVPDIGQALAAIGGHRHPAARRAATARIHGGVHRLPAPGRPGRRADRAGPGVRPSVNPLPRGARTPIRAFRGFTRTHRIGNSEGHANVPK